MLGVMIDCSRNAVMTCDAVIKYADLLAKMGYDTLMLYTEDTYEVNGEPYFGYMRGRYTKEEIKKIDAYCKDKGIELIPCIQTLAHVNAIFHATGKYMDIRDCDDILLIDEERTYELLDHIFETLAECFSSRKVHIGMDEAGKVGLGKYLKEHGYADRFELINHHLHKVCDFADKYGFQPMLWSDMFCSLASGGGEYWTGGNLEEIRQKANLPEQVSLVYWDYYSDDYNRYERMLETNKAFQRPVIFAGGAWTWKGFMPDNGFSIKNTEVALKACKNQGVTDILQTAWGDDGGECSRLAGLPALLYTAEVMHGNTDLECIKQKFYELTEMKWDDFMLLDQLDLEEGEKRLNASKYLLYNDPFMGLNDYRVTENVGAYYSQLEQKLQQVLVTPTYQSIFEVAKSLCKVLAVKAELGIKTRKAYLANEKVALKDLAEQDYQRAIEAVEQFYHVFGAWWESENKPFGFDIQDIRLGGLILRLKHCSQRLLAYAANEIDSIPELEEVILEGTESPSWKNIVTPNVVSHLYFG